MFTRPNNTSPKPGLQIFFFVSTRAPLLGCLGASPIVAKVKRGCLRGRMVEGQQGWDRWGRDGRHERDESTG